MKSTISIFLTATFFLASTPKAQAGDDGWAAFGGFLGGVIVSSISHDIKNRHHDRHREEVVYYDLGHNSYGHYEYRTIKTWVPGCWTYREDHHGRTIKVWVEGYYTYEKERIWVRDRYRSRSYGHRGSYYSRGYSSSHHRSRSRSRHH